MSIRADPGPRNPFAVGLVTAGVIALVFAYGMWVAYAEALDPMTSVESVVAGLVWIAVFATVAAVCFAGAAVLGGIRWLTSEPKASGKAETRVMEEERT